MECPPTKLLKSAQKPSFLGPSFSKIILVDSRPMLTKVMPHHLIHSLKCFCFLPYDRKFYILIIIDQTYGQKSINMRYLFQSCGVLSTPAAPRPLGTHSCAPRHPWLHLRPRSCMPDVASHFGRSAWRATKRPSHHLGAEGRQAVQWA